MQPEALVVFLRFPALGKVKTRIAATTGEESALRIYNDLLKITFESLSKLPLPVFLFYEGGLPPVSARDPRYVYYLQIEGSLDEKISHAALSLLQHFKKIVIIGSDCPDLSPNIILDSFLKLDSCDAVVGPAKDGGFYLLGCKNLPPVILENILWGTSAVCSQLLHNIEMAQFSYTLLEALSDIDTEDDWKSFSTRNHASDKGWK